VEHVEGTSWRGYGNAEAHVEWNGMDMDPHYGSICGFRGMDLNPAKEDVEIGGKVSLRTPPYKIKTIETDSPIRADQSE
jgi:hypothetical protein